MPLVLYSTAGSPPCRAVLMLKELLNLNLEIREVIPMYGENLKPEYVAKNPIHTIPYLEDGDFGLADSHAIITYLVSKYGGEKKAELYPGDLSARATIDQRLFLEATVLFPRFITPFRTVLGKQLTALPEEDVKKIEEAYGFLEKYLEATTFVAADHITVADISCVASVSTLHSMVPIGDNFPRVREWWNRIKEQAWYEKGNTEGLEVLSGFWKKFLQEPFSIPGLSC